MQGLIAAQFMTEEVITFSPGMDIMDAIFELTTRGISGAPVIDEQGLLVGILTERDCLDPFIKASYYEQPGGPVSEFMSREVRTIDAETDLLEVARLFAETKFRRFPVTKGSQVVGLISRRDTLRALLDFSFHRSNKGN